MARKKSGSAGVGRMLKAKRGTRQVSGQPGGSKKGKRPKSQKPYSQ